MGIDRNERGYSQIARPRLPVAPSVLPVSGPGLTFHMVGGDVVLEYMASIGRGVRKVARRALSAAGRPVLAAIKARIRRVTGTLSRGLRLRVGKNDRRNRFSVLIASWTTREAFAMTRSSGAAKRIRAAGQKRDRYRVWYDASLEKGHVNARGGGRTPAHPFMAPGFEATAQTAYQIAGEALLTEVDAA
ncbi:MAG: HK97 gp10 family phage protein [Planctomycetes bacterium]|nr:HK97 gp10 family phage protein [Planctomycetota bacterium]